MSTVAEGRRAFVPHVGADLEYTVEPLPVRWALAPVDVATAWTQGWSSWARSAVERRATPMDLLHDTKRFWSTASERTEPAWSTPFAVVREWPVARLLDFNEQPRPDGVPTLILPPQAGHASTVADHAPDQSQVRTALEQGLAVFVLEWLEAKGATTKSTIEDYVRVLDEAVEQLGGRVNLVGDCQGGWLATIYAALRPTAVASLSMGGAPIDTHAGKRGAEVLESSWLGNVAMWPYRALIGAGGGVHRGRSQIAAFKVIDPASEMTRLANLWGSIADPGDVSRYRRFAAWFESSRDMAGPFYLWVVEHLFVRNELAAGTLEVAGERVDLSRITVPINLIAGSRDHITPPAQVWALAEHVSTPPEQVHGRLVDAGHLGLFMGHRALAEHWAEVFATLPTE